MKIRDYISQFKNIELQKLAKKLCKEYGVDLRNSIECYEMTSIGCLNEKWLSLIDIFEIMKNL